MMMMSPRTTKRSTNQSIDLECIIYILSLSFVFYDVFLLLSAFFMIMSSFFFFLSFFLRLKVINNASDDSDFKSRLGAIFGGRGTSKPLPKASSAQQPTVGKLSGKLKRGSMFGDMFGGASNKGKQASPSPIKPSPKVSAESKAKLAGLFGGGGNGGGQVVAAANTTQQQQEQQQSQEGVVVGGGAGVLLRDDPAFSKYFKVSDVEKN